LQLPPTATTERAADKILELQGNIFNNWLKQ
jgi:hypothetical protein